MRHSFWRWLTTDDLGTVTLDRWQQQAAQELTEGCLSSAIVRHASVEDPAVQFWRMVDERKRTSSVVTFRRIVTR